MDKINWRKNWNFKKQFNLLQADHDGGEKNENRVRFNSDHVKNR